MTFGDGIPALGRPIITPCGLAVVRRFHENGDVDIYVGQGRTFTVPSSTTWKALA